MTSTAPASLITKDETASVYNQLGIVAQEQGDLAGAEQWYRKALTV